MPVKETYILRAKSFEMSSRNIRHLNEIDSQTWIEAVASAWLDNQEGIPISIDTMEGSEDFKKTRGKDG